MLYYLNLHKNWQSVLTSSSSHVILSLTSPNYQPSTLDTLCTMLVGHTTFPSFLHPTFRQWHWSPHNVDINNSSIHGSQFRKEVISYWYIVSKSLIIMPDFSMYLYQCILFLLYLIDFSMIFNLCNMFISLQSCFVKLSSHLRDCNRQDDWHPMSNYELWIIMNYTICKPIWSCITWTHYSCFVKLLLVNLYSYTHVSSQVLFCYVQQHYLIIFVNLYYHTPHFITCANFVLLNLLYLHIYMIMWLMYDIFVLLYVFHFFSFLLHVLYLWHWYMYICILHYSSRSS